MARKTLSRTDPDERTPQREPGGRTSRRPGWLEHLEPRLLLSRPGFPDLAVENLSAPPEALAGSTITVEYDLVNHGDVDFPAYGVDMIYAGGRRRPRLIDIPAGTVAHDEAIAPGESVHVIEQVVLSPDAHGGKFVAVWTNPAEIYPEGGQTANNRAATAIRVEPIPPADLLCIDLAATDLVTGREADINATIRNDGDSPARGGWTDEIYLSANARLDRKDIRVASLDHWEDLAPGASYDLHVTATVPPEALGCKYLIVHTNADGGHGENRQAARNNKRAFGAMVAGFRLEGLYGGAFLARGRSQRLNVVAAGDPGSRLDVTLSDFDPLPIAPGGDPGTVRLADDAKLDPRRKRTPLGYDTSGLPLGNYTLHAVMRDGEAVLAEQTLSVTLVDHVVRRSDRLGDTVGGDDYEVFNLEVARAGDALLWRLGTNYDGEDCDFRILAGRGRGADVFGLACGDRTTGAGEYLSAGALYVGAEFAPGEVVPRIPALIDTFQEEVFGESFLIDEPGAGAWQRNLLGGVMLDALGDAAAGGVTLSWSMWCGNDFIKVPYRAPLKTSTWAETNLQDAGLREAVSDRLLDWRIDRGEMVDILREAGSDDGTVDRIEMADLRKLLKDADALGLADHVRVLAAKVVQGDRGNRLYQGDALGNLRNGSDQDHLDKLVDKWFLGKDHPTTPHTYQPAGGDLFRSGVSYTDVDQGALADCYFVSALAALAHRSPSRVQDMFIDNGDGTYTVRFYTSRGADYVTVDRDLPTDANGRLVYANMGDHYASTSNELWVPLAEKAYAQLAEAGSVGWWGRRMWRTVFADNSYKGIEGGSFEHAIREIAGERARQSRLGASSRQSIVDAYNAGDMVAIGTKDHVSQGSPFVGDHSYALIGVDPASGDFTLYNPHGSTLQVTWQEIQTDVQSWGRTL